MNAFAVPLDAYKAIVNAYNVECSLKHITVNAFIVALDACNEAVNAYDERLNAYNVTVDAYNGAVEGLALARVSLRVIIIPHGLGSAYSARNGLRSETPQSTKCRTFRVTRVRWCS